MLLLFLLFPFLVQAEDLQLKIISTAEDLPENFCTIWKKGDYLVSDGEYLVLLGGSARPIKDILNFPASNARGSIISFAPAGENLISNLSIGSPIIRLKNKAEYLTYSSLKPIKKNIQKGNLAFNASVFYIGKAGKKAEIETIYSFYPHQGRIDISSTIKNTGIAAFEDLSYRFYFTSNHRYFFSPFQRKKHPELNFRLYQKKGHYLGWLNLNPLQPLEDEKEPQPGHLAPGEEFKLNYILLVDSQASDLLGKIYQILNIKPEKASLHFKDFDGNLMEVVVQDVHSSSVFFRSFLKNTPSLEILLPKGTYSVKAHFFPAVCEEILVVEEGGKNICTLRNLPHERIKVKIRNSKGEFVPGKVTFIGLDPTKTPYFKPVLQKQAKGGQLEKATLPYALTNPVFIDVDGNGKFDPPLPEKIKLASDIPESKSDDRGN